MGPLHTRWRCTVVALVLLLAGASIPAAAEEATKPVTVKAAGIELEYPSDWTSLPLTKKSIRRTKRQLADGNPELAAQLSADFAKLAKFYAIDLDAAFGGRFAENVTVLVMPFGGFPASLESFTSYVSGEYASLGATVLGTSETRVGRRTAYRADVTLVVNGPDGTAQVARIGQLLLRRRAADTVVVTVTTADDERGTQVADALLASVQPN